MIAARYADGASALTLPAACTLDARGVGFRVGAASHHWPYGELLRADDGNGAIMLKRRPDTGERLIFDGSAAGPLRAGAPDLFTPQAQGVERGRLVVGLAGVAFSLAAAFLIGVPMAAGPVAAMMPESYRAQISQIAWSQVEELTDSCEDTDGQNVLNDLAFTIMEAAGVEGREGIYLTVVETPMPNAFALPDRSIVVTTGLIQLAEGPDELAGVIAHEIAHIEHNHVMQNIVRNIGAGVFFDIVFGGAGVGQAIAVASVNLAGLRYSRAYEREADARGLDYLDAASINTGALAALFARMSARANEPEAGAFPAFLSSHPPSAERAATAEARARPGLAPALSQAQWRRVQAACGARPAREETAPAAPAQTKPAQAPGEEGNKPSPGLPTAGDAG